LALGRPSAGSILITVSFFPVLTPGAIKGSGLVALVDHGHFSLNPNPMRTFRCDIHEKNQQEAGIQPALLTEV
jgi:hypothetical protein